MKTSDHAVSGEELMAYLDGEVESSRADAIRAHLAACDACRQTAAALADVTNGLGRWQVGEPPPTLRLPAAEARRGPWSLKSFQLASWRPAVAAAAVVLVGAVGVWWSSSPEPAELMRYVGRPERAATPAAATPSPDSRGLGYVAGRPEPKRSGGGGGGGGANTGADAPQAGGVKGRLIARMATLAIVTRDFDAARPAIDRVLDEVGGFIGRLDVSGARGAQRTLSASLRVPAARLDAALASLKQIGKVTAESESGDDVTEQSRNLDVRLANARVTEKRLVDVLEHRTGKVADVLEAEREIARVRGEIEQMEAERKSLDRRVSYAIVSLTVEEERKAELDLGPLPPSVRLRNALVDGLRGACDSLFDVAVLLLSAGPTLLLWVALFAWPGRVVWRRLRPVSDRP